MELTISRKKWARGGKRGLACLLNDEGNRCCLGTLTRNLCRVPLTKMIETFRKRHNTTLGTACAEYTVPSLIPDEFIHANPQLISELGSYISTDEFHDLRDIGYGVERNRILLEDIFAFINDSTNITDRTREKLLTKYFKLLLNIDIRFVP